MTRLVSAVIVCHRSREALEACLASLAECAKRLPVEVVVVDNASGDGTVEWLEHAHPHVTVVANAENRGFTRAVNQGMERARGEMLLMLNPDCEVPPAALERLRGELEADPGLAAVAPALLDRNGRLARSCGRFPTLWTLLCEHLGFARAFPDAPLLGAYKHGGRAVDTACAVDWASGAALLIPRAAWITVGGLDERIFMSMEEVDWCRRAKRAGLGVRYLPSARIVHPGQASSRRLRRDTYLHDLRSRVHYFRKHHGPLGAPAAKAILAVSLALKWVAAGISRARRVEAGVYVAGMEAVWAA